MRARATRGMETRDTAKINTKRLFGSQVHYTSIGLSLICKLGPRLMEAKVKLNGDHVPLGVINMGSPIHFRNQRPTTYESKGHR